MSRTRPPACATSPALPLLWGRDSESAAVEHLVMSADGAMRGLVLCGEPGIGKSSLWARGIAGAKRARTETLSAACLRSESEMPYATLDILLSDLLDEQASALPPPQRRALEGALLRATHDTTVDPHTVAAGVTSLVRLALDRGPVMLAVDDLQWLDSETHTCLAYAIRRLADRQLRVLVTVRTPSPLWSPNAPPDDALATLVESLGARCGENTRVWLGPLSHEAIGQMVHDRLGTDSRPAHLQHLAAQTGGNPFWALEFEHSRRHSTGDTTPKGLTQFVADRLARLDREVVDAACLVAVLGRARLSTVLAALRSDDESAEGHDLASDAEQNLDKAVTAGLLSTDGRYLVPAHPLIGTALLAVTPPLRRRRWHLRASAIANSPEARALHLLKAFAGQAADAHSEIRGEAVSVPLSREQANELTTALDDATVAARRRGAVHAATGFARHAKTIAERHPDGPDAGELTTRRVSLAELYAAHDDPDNVLAALEGIDFTLLTPELLERAAPLLAETLNEQRSAQAARAVADTVDALPRSLLPPEALRRRDALVETLRADKQCGAVDDLRAHGSRSVELLHRSPTQRPLRRRALGALAYALLDDGDPVDALLDRIEALGRADPLEPSSGVGVELLRGASHWYATDLPGTRQHFSVAFERHLIIGDEPAIVFTGDLLAYVEIVAGDLAAAEATLHRIDEHTGRPRRTALPWAGFARGELHRVRGEHGVLLALLDEMEGDAGHSWRHSWRSVAMTSRLRGMVAWQRGDTAGAVHHLERFAAASDEAGYRDVHHRLEAEDHLAEALIVDGELLRAQRIVHGLGSYDRGASHDMVRGRQERLLARLATRREDLEQAAILARNSVARLERGGFPAEYGRALTTLADVHVARGDIDAAAKYRHDAHAIFTRIGYRWWADRTRTEQPIEKLTPSERAVAELIATGATNRETASTLHLSVRTVENHLAHAYPKLGVGSRKALVDLIAGVRRPDST